MHRHHTTQFCSPSRNVARRAFLRGSIENRKRCCDYAAAMESATCFAALSDVVRSMSLSHPQDRIRKAVTDLAAQAKSTSAVMREWREWIAPDVMCLSREVAWSSYMYDVCAGHLHAASRAV